MIANEKKNKIKKSNGAKNVKASIETKNTKSSKKIKDTKELKKANSTKMVKKSNGTKDQKSSDKVKNTKTAREEKKLSPSGKAVILKNNNKTKTIKDTNGSKKVLNKLEAKTLRPVKSSTKKSANIPLPLAAKRAAKNSMENKFKHIKGWGVDIDLKNDPTYPIKFRTDEEQKGYSWDRPSQQIIKEEVLHSNERPNLSSVFGTSVPPKGLSGMIRRYAFKHSESNYAHWLPLIMADRIGVVEGIFQDIFKGHIPNIIKERGWSRMDFKYNKKRVIKKVLLAAVLTTAVVMLVNNKRRNK